jgi:hypothetical protein
MSEGGTNVPVKPPRKTITNYLATALIAADQALAGLHRRVSKRAARLN